MDELENNLNEYISGKISFLTYRERRAYYINKFVESGFIPDDTIPLNHPEQQQIKNAVLSEINHSQKLNPADLTIKGGPSSIAKKQYFALAVMILLAVGAWYYSGKLTPPDTEKAQVTEHQTPESLPTTDISEYKFILDFVKMDQWNSDTLSDFLVKWQALSRLEKKKAKQSQAFIRLKNSLRLRIKEQQALQSTSNNKAAERQENLLIWFASQLAVSVG